MNLQNKELFDELMEMVDGLTENARRLHDEVEFVNQRGSLVDRIGNGVKLGEAMGCINAASQITAFAKKLIDQ